MIKADNWYVSLFTITKQNMRQKAQETCRYSVLHTQSV